MTIRYIIPSVFRLSSAKAAQVIDCVWQTAVNSGVMDFQLARAAAPLLYALDTAVAVTFKHSPAHMLPAPLIQPPMVSDSYQPARTPRTARFHTVNLR